MKKYLEIAMGAMAVVGAVAATPAMAGTGNACTGVAASSYNMTTASNSFVQIPFTGKCSANVFMSWEDSQTVMAVGAASKKGKNIFIGHTNGGGVRPKGTATADVCAASGCTQQNAIDGANAAFTQSSS